MFWIQLFVISTLAATPAALSDCPLPSISNDNLHGIPKVVDFGSSHVLTCPINLHAQSDCEQNFTVNWYKDGNLIQFQQEISSTNHSIRLHQNMKRTVELLNVQLTDSGNYSCAVSAKNSKCNDLSCYPSESVAYMHITVESVVNKIDNNDDFPPRPRRKFNKKRIYLSRDTHSDNETIIANGMQLKQFQMQMVISSRYPNLSVEWHKISGGFSAQRQFLNTSLVKFNCTRRHTGYKSRWYNSRKLICLRAIAIVKTVNALTVGEYEAIASNKFYNLTRTFRLEEPSIQSVSVDFNKNSSVRVGSSIVLDCSVNQLSNIILVSVGRSRPSYRNIWSWSNKSVIGIYKPFTNQTTIGNITVMDTKDSILLNNGNHITSQINITSRLQEGYYACIAQPISMKYFSNYKLAYITVEVPDTVPTHIDFNKNTTVCIGSTIKLDCTVNKLSNIVLVRVGDSLPSYNLVWPSSNKSVVAEYRPAITRIGDVSAIADNINSDKKQIQIELNISAQHQQGYYACMVQPINGANYSDFKLAYISVQDGCFRRVSTQVFIILGILSFLLMAVVVGTVLYCVCTVRNRNKPILKRLRLRRVENAGAYMRSRLPTDAPLLTVDNSPHVNSHQLFSNGALMVPDVVVERVSRRSRRSGVSEMNKEVRYLIPSCPVLEVDRHKVSMCKQIGEGAFGSVHRGKVHYGSAEREVAIKQLKPNHTEEELIAMVKEMEIMRLMNKNPHPNIIKLVGVCAKKGPFLLLVELARHGSLRDFLKERVPSQQKVPQYLNLYHHQLSLPSVMPTVTQLQLLHFCEDVANALNFMASICIVHRDIAARNVLVDGDHTTGRLVAKVADFGLTRNTEDKDYYRVVNEGKLPMKWLAPECLHSRIFSTKSDVWAYGILLYEIFTFGEVPYPGVSPSEVPDYLQRGNINSKPPLASNEVYSIMRDCWAQEPALRPSFSSLCNRVSCLRQLELSNK